MILTEKCVLPSSAERTSLTVSDTPSSVTEPLGAIIGASSAGTLIPTRVESPSGQVPTTCATQSTWPVTIWPCRLCGAGCRHLRSEEHTSELQSRQYLV